MSASSSAGIVSPATTGPDSAHALETFAQRKARCEQIILHAGRVLTAYSGGVDSSLVARLAHKLLGENALAVTAVSPSLAKADLEEAVAVAKVAGFPHRLARSGETELAAYQENTPRRCYFCKHTAYDLFTRIAKEEGYACVMDGTNADDVGDHRPGRIAAREYGVRSPLQEAGLTKADVRAWAKELELPNWDKPAAACLASRIPYGTRVTHERLQQIEKAEASLRALGFRQFRVRHHGQVARLEIETSQLTKALEMRVEMAAAVKAAGFHYAALDLEGFRSGSMNETLSSPASHVS